jgi:hypothetical protein
MFRSRSDLTFNELTGELPSEIGNLKNLTTLYARCILPAAFRC